MAIVWWALLSDFTFGAQGRSLWTHLARDRKLGEVRSAQAHWSEESGSAVLQVSVSGVDSYAWVSLPPPSEGWDLSESEFVESEVVNTGAGPVHVMLWVVGAAGWEAVPAVSVIEAGKTQRLRVSLRETHPDKTPKINPGKIDQVQLMVLRNWKERLGKTVVARSSEKGVRTLELRSLNAVGNLPIWTPPPGRLELPPVEERRPGAGRRVRYRLAGDESSGIDAVLNLPRDWREGGRYPLIVEFPGNIFFTEGCYSTGRPEQCVIGYGICRGEGAICLGLPFVNRKAGGVAENGWGVEEETAGFATAMVKEVCEKFGGDSKNVVLTGFSRGALACGYIGLRDDRIASLWKGFHACQHYDGDGWNGATMEGALVRARRFRGRSVFQTDNSESFLKEVMDAMGVPVRFANSGLGSHATAMFLDERPSTRDLREWFRDLVSKP